MWRTRLVAGRRGSGKIALRNRPVGEQENEMDYMQTVMHRESLQIKLWSTRAAAEKCAAMMFGYAEVLVERVSMPHDINADADGMGWIISVLPQRGATVKMYVRRNMSCH